MGANVDPRRALSPRQRQVLAFISERIKASGFPPTLREIAKEIGVQSTNGVSDHLISLERKGYLRRESTLARGIAIVDPDPQLFAAGELEQRIELMDLAKTASPEAVRAALLAVKEHMMLAQRHGEAEDLEEQPDEDPKERAQV